MDTNERMIVIEKKSKTLPGVAVSRTVTFPEIPIEDLERALEEEAFDELETGDTIEIPTPKLPPSDDDFEGPTGVYEIGYRATADVYWVHRV